MRVTAIAAVADNGVIGSGDDMLWHLPQDWRRFRQVTMGHAYLEGRRTFEQLGILAGRRIIVVTRDPNYSAAGVSIVHSVEEGLDLARSWNESQCYVGGGAQIYEAALPLVHDLDITRVHQRPDGDAKFPKLPAAQWRQITSEPGDGFDFCRYARITRTARLELSPMASQDIDEVTGLCTDPRTYHHSPGDGLPGAQDLRGSLKRWVTQWTDVGHSYWMIRRIDTGEFVGIGGLRPKGGGLWNLAHRFVHEQLGHGFFVELAGQAASQVADLDAGSTIEMGIRPWDTLALRHVEQLGMTESEELLDDRGLPELNFRTTAAAMAQRVTV